MNFYIFWVLKFDPIKKQLLFEHYFWTVKVYFQVVNYLQEVVRNYASTLRLQK